MILLPPCVRRFAPNSPNEPAGLWELDLADCDPSNPVNEEVLVGPIPTEPDAHQRRRLKKLGSQ